MSSPVPSPSTAQIIPFLGAGSIQLEVLKSRLETFSYAVLNFGTPDFESLNLLHPPLVAILPFSARTTLDQLQQMLSTYQNRFPDANTTYLGLYTGRLPFKINDLYRIGLNGFFQSPLEDELLINKVCELAPVSQNHKDLTLDQLIRINIIEIEREKHLPFDVFLYLPVNRKTILYLEKDSSLDEKTIRKFHEHSHYNLFIRRSDVKVYQDHTSRMIATFATEEEISDVEKAKKIASRLGGVMGGFFGDEDVYSEEEGKQMVENLKAFVHDLEDASGSKKEMREGVSAFASQKLTSASHSQNVAAYCAFFGLTLGLTEPETLRMGGLLHDIGLSELPPELLGKDERKMTPEELASYRLHPGAGKTALVRKKIDVPKEVLDMIMFHHEHTDGSGYPLGKKGDEIPPYAKVCAFADEFDKLTSIRPGYPQLSPKEAVLRIAGLDGKPASPIYDPKFHRPLVDTYLNEGKTETSNPKPAAPDAAPSGGVHVKVGPGGVKIPVVTLARLLKTEQFAKSDYLPELKTGDAKVDEALEELSEQVSEHFKKMATA